MNPRRILVVDDDARLAASQRRALAHESVCISLTPPGLAGLLSKLGMYPVGTIDLALTAEMIHIWIVPAAPEPFGDVDEAWKRFSLSAVGTQR